MIANGMRSSTLHSTVAVPMHIMNHSAASPRMSCASGRLNSNGIAASGSANSSTIQIDAATTRSRPSSVSCS